MFRIVCDPSSGSAECLTEITCDIFVCLVGVWQRNFEPAVCVHGATHHAHENITSNFSQARSAPPDDGSQTIRNISE